MKWIIFSSVVGLLLLLCGLYLYARHVPAKRMAQLVLETEALIPDPCRSLRAMQSQSDRGEAQIRGAKEAVSLGTSRCVNYVAANSGEATALMCGNGQWQDRLPELFQHCHGLGSLLVQDVTSLVCAESVLLQPKGAFASRSDYLGGMMTAVSTYASALKQDGQADSALLLLAHWVELDSRLDHGESAPMVYPQYELWGLFHPLAEMIPLLWQPDTLSSEALARTRDTLEGILTTQLSVTDLLMRHFATHQIAYSMPFVHDGHGQLLGRWPEAPLWWRKHREALGCNRWLGSLSCLRKRLEASAAWVEDRNCVRMLAEVCSGGVLARDCLTALTTGEVDADHYDDGIRGALRRLLVSWHVRSAMRNRGLTVLRHFHRQLILYRLHLQMSLILQYRATQTCPSLNDFVFPDWLEAVALPPGQHDAETSTVYRLSLVKSVEAVAPAYKVYMHEIECPPTPGGGDDDGGS